MNLCFVVVNDLDKFEDLLREFNNRKLYGGTIFDTLGMAKAMGRNLGMGHAIRGFLNMGRPFNKTIMMAVTDEQLQAVKESFETVIGDLDGDNVGIIVALPLTTFWGVRDYAAKAEEAL
ncbi:MAG: hypothetical protein ACOX9C_12245 [Kiritimatiellia bacterium]|jgi:hypothetical protein